MTAQATQVVDDVELYIKAIQMTYPSISPSRGSVLCHMFLTIGNGYDWKDGRLVSVCNDAGEGKVAQALQKLRCGGEFNFEQAMRDYVETDLTDWTPESREEYVQKALMSSQWPWPRYMSYSSEKYSRIMHIPDDIRMDWLNCAVDVLLAARKLRTDFKPEEMVNWQPYKHRTKRQWLELAETNREMRKISNKIIDEIIEEEKGHKPKPVYKSKRQDKAEHLAWKRCYSPQALASRYNQGNTETIRLANKVIGQLFNRFPFLTYQPIERLVNHVPRRLLVA